MRFADFKCPICDRIDEDIPLSIYEKGYVPMCKHNGIVIEMERIFSFGSSRVINYSPEYKGGCDKDLYNQPDALGNRK